MNRWYRQALPCPNYLLGFSLLLLMCDTGLLLFWLTCTEMENPVMQLPVVYCTLLAAAFICSVAAGMMALFRISRYPANGGSFHEWLSCTPWQPLTRTPFGPWKPVLQDVLPLGILGLVMAIHAVPVYLFYRFRSDMTLGIDPVVMFGFALVGPAIVFSVLWTLAAFARICRNWNWSLYAVALAIASFIHLAIRTPVMFSVSIIVALVVTGIALLFRRMKQVLGEVPERCIGSPYIPAGGSERTSRLYETLSPLGYKPDPVRLLEFCRSRTTAIVMLLILWLTLPRWEPVGLGFAVMWVGLTALLRVAFYHDRNHPPWSLAARWATGMLIIPNYSRVWLPSIAMFLAALIVVLLGAGQVLPLQLAGPLTVVVPLIIGLRAGPDYEQWSLTAPSSLPIREPVPVNSSSKGRKSGAAIRMRR